MFFSGGIFSYFSHAIYPCKCMCCGNNVGPDEHICRVCKEYIERFETQKRCKTCGMIKERCRCKRQVFRFSGLIAPFYNSGLAKTGFYKYKLCGKERFADYFAEEMVKSIKSEYANINFDIVCSVPASAKRMRKYGYSPTEQLGKRISKSIGVRFVKDALGCKRVKISQHKLGYKKRFEIIKGRFYPRLPLKGKTVLLVDDISTTGATLDECTLQLLKCGANEVWCVCALITDMGYKVEREYTKEILRQQGFVVEK